MLPKETEQLVAIASAAGYGVLESPVPAPELPSGHATRAPQAGIRDLFALWGLDSERAGTPRWNPLGDFVPPGSRVVLKPNWVMHQNAHPEAGLDCLVTHPSVIEGVLEYLALARPADVVVGDAPLQGCDFDALLDSLGMEPLIRRFRDRGLNVRTADFRRTVLHGKGFGATRTEDRRPGADYVLFDLAAESLLEPLAADARKFRVTMYDPDLLRRTHAPGRHQYLIAREVIDADVVISLPKLKTHRKAGITGALKNLVGINGNKEYLPHHRKGGADGGGDCYQRSNWLKRRAEDLLDTANRRPPGRFQALLGTSAWALLRCAKAFGADLNLEGAWYGNDTVWRTCLDLQRILLYGRPDGSLDPARQRLVLTITDAIIAGEGEGPLANTPVPAGFLTGSANPAAAEWVHARLMGFDPQLIPLVREAFGVFSFPLASFSPTDIRVRTASGDMPAAEVEPVGGRRFVPPEGWVGHCELPIESGARALPVPAPR
jgi:uncharacterized protein (DUF362 family)